VRNGPGAKGPGNSAPSVRSAAGSRPQLLDVPIFKTGGARAGRLRVLFDDASALRPVYVVYPSRRFLAAKVRLFIDALAAMIEPMQPIEAAPRVLRRGDSRESPKASGDASGRRTKGRSSSRRAQ